MAGLGRLVRDTVAHKETDKKRGEAVLICTYTHIYARMHQLLGQEAGRSGQEAGRRGAGACVYIYSYKTDKKRGSAVLVHA